MQNFSIVMAVALMLPSLASAASTRPLKLDTPTSAARPVPLKGKASSSACAAYGPGFVKIDGTETCVQIGGSISVGAGVRR
jgi:hypothetical protein